MSYGINVFNEFGEQVFDFNKALTIHESGITKTSAQIGLLDFANRYVGPSTRELFMLSNFFSGTSGLLPHHIGTGTGFFTNTSVSNFYRFPTPLVSRTSTYFYQVGSTGLLHHSEHVVDSAYWTTTGSQFGMFAMLLPTNNTPLPYVRVDEGNFDSLSGTHGLKVLDGSGQTVFDSRASFLTVSEVLFVPKATMQGILISNNVVDITLRTPVPNCYISAPNHVSVYTDDSTQFRHIKISQLNDSTIRLSRHILGPDTGSTYLLTVFQDTVIAVARDPFA
jgi:hypothetical protein